MSRGCMSWTVTVVCGRVGPSRGEISDSTRLRGIAVQCRLLLVVFGLVLKLVSTAQSVDGRLELCLDEELVLGTYLDSEQRGRKL